MTNDVDREVVEEFRSRGGVVESHGLGSFPIALITTIGAKSGAERTTPLTYTKDGDDVIVIASNYGRENHPAWFHNIKANQDVRVEIGSESYDATATLLLEGSERQRLWDERVRQFPNFKEYQDSTDRLIPVVVLRRR